jgi:hypothetical protein
VHETTQLQKHGKRDPKRPRVTERTDALSVVMLFHRRRTKVAEYGSNEE